MIKLKNKYLLQPSFNEALVKLENTAGLDVKTAYNIMKLMAAIRQETRMIQAGFIKLVKEYAALDEKGEVKPNVINGKEVPGTFYIPEEKAEEYKKARAEFDEIEFQIDREKLLAPLIEKVAFTPAELAAVDMIIDFGDSESV